MSARYVNHMMVIECLLEHVTEKKHTVHKRKPQVINCNLSWRPGSFSYDSGIYNKKRSVIQK